LSPLSRASCLLKPSSTVGVGSTSSSSTP
jgi:hypothetical protein